MLKLKIILALVSVLILSGGFLGLRWHYIELGRSLCQTEVIIETQEVVIENDKKLRKVRAYTVSDDGLADRMHDGTY